MKKYRQDASPSGGLQTEHRASGLQWRDHEAIGFGIGGDEGEKWLDIF